jgi:hypothetical protein
MKIISLGTCCEPVFVIKHFYPKMLRYPFDWLSIQSLSAASMAIENDFNNFLIWQQGDGKEQQIVDYNIKIHHNTLKDAVERRIHRFRSDIKGSNEPTLFIIKTHLVQFSHPTVSNCYILTIDNSNELKNLRNIILKYKGNDRFCILAVNESLIPRKILYDNNIIINWIIVSKSIGINCNYITDAKEYNHQWKKIIKSAISYLYAKCITK